MSLPAAILAGGLGTRLRPFTERIPKALIDIDGVPFIHHQLRLLCSRGIHRAVLCLGYLGEAVRDSVGDGSRFGIEIACSFDGPVLRGTAGAIRDALPLLGNAFFVIYGDSYLPCDYQTVEASFHAQGKPALMTVFRNVGQWDTSNVEFDGHRILAYDKVNHTPAMRHIDYGLGVFHRSAFETVPAGEPADLADLYRDLLARDALAALEVGDRFYEIGSFAGIRDLTAFLRTQ